MSTQIQFPQSVYDAIVGLHNLVSVEDSAEPRRIIQMEQGDMGRPHFVIDQEHVVELLEMGQSVTDIAKVFGVSRSTLHRRMEEWNISVNQLYSQLCDADLDDLVHTILSQNPNAGYRRMIGLLKARGHRVQWTKVRASMHRVDTAGIVARISQLGCVVRRTYSVPRPRSLVHIDTNHKLIR